MQNKNYRLNIFELPKIKVTLNGTEVLIKGALDESAKYNRINTYMLYIPTAKKGIYRVLVANWDVNYPIPAGKVFLVDTYNKTSEYLEVASATKRANAATMIREYEAIVASHRKSRFNTNNVASAANSEDTEEVTIASTANHDDEAYTESTEEVA